MTQSERLAYLIQYLIKEQNLTNIKMPNNLIEQQHLLRSLMNVRPPQSISSEFLEIQDTYLQEETKRKQPISIQELKQIKPDLYLWRDDITRLQVDAIVNAANSQMLGCFIPCHGCIDNAIHSAAGIQLRLTCHDIMEAQRCSEETGKAKITPAFNLPSKYVIHTVGPIVYSTLQQKECDLLQSCYENCLRLADEHHVKQIAFCCISTGEFHFPNEKAAEIAIATVKRYKKETKSEIEVIFNVFKEKDEQIYRELLTKHS